MLKIKELGIYVHIPFCKQKCYYCDFVSYTKCEEKIEKYIQALKKEIKFESKNKKEYKINTIYIGGGTPSFIDAKYIKEIISTIKENYTVLNDAEITIEVNPGTVNEEKLRLYKNIEINRLSIGLQSTKNKILKDIGRIHTYEEFLECYNLTKKVGFENINVDLMLALPNQKISDVEESLKKIIKLNPNHISFYSLIVEENTPIEKMLKEGKIKLPDEEIERSMYWRAKQILEENNYIHYEISNFSKENYESKHNLNCWNQEEYVGFGVAAHSYIDNKRYSNTESIEEYLKNIEENNLNKNREILELQTQEEKKKEYMLLGLRKIDGVNIQEFKNKFIENPIYKFHNELENLVNQDLIEIDLNKIKLTAKGLDFANKVWEKFV